MARAALMRCQDTLRKIATAARPLMGLIFTAVGVMLKSSLAFVIIEAWLLDRMPLWLLAFLSRSKISK